MKIPDRKSIAYLKKNESGRLKSGIITNRVYRDDVEKYWENAQF